MRLDDLRIVTSSSFIKAIQDNTGKNALSVAYPTKELDALITTAKEFIILIAHNNNSKIALEEIQSPTSRLGMWVRSNDLVMIAAYALALHNRGSKLRGATLFFNESTNLRPHEMQAKNSVLLNGIVFEYIWRGILQFVLKQKELDAQDGGVLKFIRAYKPTNDNVESCYVALSSYAGLEAPDTERVADYVKKDKVFQTAYNS